MEALDSQSVSRGIVFISTKCLSFARNNSKASTAQRQGILFFNIPIFQLPANDILWYVKASETATNVEASGNSGAPKM